MKTQTTPLSIRAKPPVKPRPALRKTPVISSTPSVNKASPSTSEKITAPRTSPPLRPTPLPRTRFAAQAPSLTTPEPSLFTRSSDTFETTGTRSSQFLNGSADRISSRHSIREKDSDSSTSSLPSFLKLPKPRPTVSCDPHTLDTLDVCHTLENLALAINKEESHSDVKHLTEDGLCLCFELQAFPGVILKTSKNVDVPIYDRSGFELDCDRETVQKRYDNTTKITQHINSGNYPHLTIPKTKLFEAIHSNGRQLFVADQKISIHADRLSSLVWKTHEKALTPAIKELVSLIQTTGLYDTHPRNCPAVQNSDGSWSLSLIDVECISSVASPKHARKGILELISTLPSENSVMMVMDMLSDAHRQSAQQTADERIHNLKALQKHEAFHINKNTNPHQATPLQLTDNQIEALDLDLNIEGTSINVRQAVKAVVQGLNDTMIAEANDKFAETTRCVAFYEGPILSSFPQGLAYAKLPGASRNDFDQLHVRKILDALAKNSHICSWEVNTFSGERPGNLQALIIWM